jgi:hypothetical protein
VWWVLLESSLNSVCRGTVTLSGLGFHRNRRIVFNDTVRFVKAGIKIHTVNTYSAQRYLPTLGLLRQKTLTNNSDVRGNDVPFAV